MEEDIDILKGVTTMKYWALAILLLTGTQTLAIEFVNYTDWDIDVLVYQGEVATLACNNLHAGDSKEFTPSSSSDNVVAVQFGGHGGQSIIGVRFFLIQQKEELGIQRRIYPSRRRMGNMYISKV